MKKTFLTAASVLLAAMLVGCGTPADGGSTNPGGTSDKVSSSDSSSASVKPPETVDYGTYASYWFPQHDYKTMPVGAYNSVPPAKRGYTKNFLVDEEIFKAYAEAGINTIMGLEDYVGENQKDVATALDFCYDYDLAYLLAYSGAWNVGSESAVRSTLATVKYHDSFAGIMLSDEPGKTMYETISQSRKTFENVLEDTSDKLYHVNLFPAYANELQLWYREYGPETTLPVESYTYEEYVNDYMEIFKPQVLSYDFYPISGSFPELSNGYFENMSVIRKTASKANIPFWVYVQTCTWRDGMRLPTDADLMWNVNTCLAYGAKGIQYFCGVTPIGFGDAIFDVNGNKTEMYDRVKKAGKMISAVDEVLMCSKSEGLILSGVMPQLKQGEARMTIPADDLIGDSYKELSSVVSNHALVGCFDYDGKTALYVVNNAIADDTIEGFTAADTVKLNFSKNINGYTIDSDGKKDFSGESLSVSLGAGEAVLVVLG